MKKALILDRDGVINIERGTYTWKIEDFRYTPGIWELLRNATKKGYLLFSITNQSGIAQGFYSFEDFYVIRNKIYDDAFYNKSPIIEMLFCPHHPSISKCLCRKPQKLLYEKIMYKYKIVPEKSYVIGDKERDLLPAKELGFKTICVNSFTSDCKVADFYVKQVNEIIDII